jgi:hypothetical protein
VKRGLCGLLYYEVGMTHGTVGSGGDGGRGLDIAEERSEIFVFCFSFCFFFLFH